MPINAETCEEESLMERPEDILNLDFDSAEWCFTSRGNYLLVREPRALHQIYHPWDISEDGDFAALSTKVSVSSDWQKPIFLNLYANDTYVSKGWEQARPHWTHIYATCHNFVNHRFKQVLVNDEVIWEQDILPLFWGYELTGDEAFLEKGAQMMRESILGEKNRGRAFGLSRYWEMQDILYYWGLHKQQLPSEEKGQQ